MKKLLFAALLASLSATAYAGNSSLTVSSGTFLAIDGWKESTGNQFRQSVVVADPSSQIGTASVDAVTGLTVHLATSSLTTTTAVKVDGSGVTQPVSGTVTANAGTGTMNAFVVNVPTVTFNGSAQPVSQSGTWTVQPGNTANTTAWFVTGGTMTVQGNNGASIPVSVSNTPAVSQSGTWTVQPGNTANTTAWLVTGGTMTVQGNNGAAFSVQGDVANGSADSGNPVKQGGQARLTLPSAVTDGQRVNQIMDKFGRDIMAIECPRDLRISTSVTLSASTSETVLLSSGAASVFNDMLLALVVNTSATAARIDFRSGGGPAAGVVDFPIYVPAGDTRGYTIAIPWPQSASASNWTVQSSASVSDIRIAALFCKNK